MLICLLLFETYQMHPSDFPCVTASVHLFGQHSTFPCFTGKRRLTEYASLSYLPLEFVRCLRAQPGEAAKRNRVVRSERPGLEFLLGPLLATGLHASYLTSLYLTSLNACWMRKLIMDFFGSYAYSLVPGNIEKQSIACLIDIECLLHI